MPRGEPSRPANAPSLCLECGHKSLSKVTQDCEHAFTYEGRAYRVQVCQLPIIKCASCGQVNFDQEALRILLDAEYFHLNILRPGEIVEARKRTGFSQRQLAAFLGIGVATLSRWEKGHLRQSRSLDNLLRLALLDDACREQLALAQAKARSVRAQPYRGHLESDERASRLRVVRYIPPSQVHSVLEDGKRFSLPKAWSHCHAG